MSLQVAVVVVVVETSSVGTIEGAAAPRQDRPNSLHAADARRGPPHGGELRQAAGVAAAGRFTARGAPMSTLRAPVVEAVGRLLVGRGVGPIGRRIANG
jgi:hypothetical protein